MTTVSPEETQPNEINIESILYHISFQRLQELRRSPIVMLASRRCPSAPSRLKADHQLKDADELVNEIAKYCAGEEGFIRPGMATQEIIFRTLLSRRNEPTSLKDLHYELTERWSTPAEPKAIGLDGLRRVLDADTYYGFARAG